MGSDEIETKRLIAQRKREKDGELKAERRDREEGTWSLRLTERLRV